MVDLKKRLICIKFCVNLRKTASETHEMLVTAVTGSVMEMQMFEWFPQNTRKRWGLRRIMSYLYRWYRWKYGEFLKIVLEDQWSINSEITGRLGIPNGTCQHNTKGGLGHVVDLHVVCALVAHWQVEAAEIVGREFWLLSPTLTYLIWSLVIYSLLRLKAHL